MIRRTFGCLANLIGTFVLLGVLTWVLLTWVPLSLVVGTIQQELPQVVQFLDRTFGDHPVTSFIPAPSGQNCGTISGRFTSAQTGRRILLDVVVQGTNSHKQMQAILDSGASKTAFPDSFLRSLGYEPISRAHRVEGVGSGASVAYTYRIPFPKVAVGDKLLPMGNGTLDVEGIKDFDLALIGPDVLERGVSLTTNGSNWTLTLPCAPGQSGN